MVAGGWEAERKREETDRGRGRGRGTRDKTTLRGVPPGIYFLQSVSIPHHLPIMPSNYNPPKD
jgi:hypothetical protein